MSDRQDVYHHYDDKAKVNVKIEKNSRGYNWEVTVNGATNIDEALSILNEAEMKLSAKYSTQETKEK